LAFSPDGKSLVSGSADTTALVWDLTGLAENGEFRTGRLSPSELQVLWEELAASPSSRATKALWKLVASPDDCVPFLRRKLRIVAPVDSRTIDERIGDLADDRFPVRKRSMDELEKIGEAAEPALRRALENRPGPEMRQRVEQLLGYLKPAATPERLRLVRAVEVLERIATPAAVELISDLSKGVPEALLTQEAKAAMARLRGK